MKKNIDFTRGERGRFHLADATFRVPVYLDDVTREFVEEIARRKNTDISSVVNELIRADKQLVEAAR
jgi:hypothetical protein